MSLRVVVGALRVVLALTFAALLVAQVFSIPGAHDSGPDGKPVAWWLIGVVEVGVACVQVVLVCTWQLLSLVAGGRIFSAAAVRWADGIVWAVGVGWLMLATLFAYVLTIADDPGGPMALLLVTLPVTAFALIMLVLRALLVQAVALREGASGA